MTAHSVPPAEASLYRALMAAPCMWPGCPCSVKYRALCARQIEMRNEPTVDELEVASMLIEGQLVIACMAQRCRDKSVRLEALMELMHRVFKNVPEATAKLEAANAMPAKSACGASDEVFDVPISPSLLGRWPITPEGRRATAIAEARKGFRVIGAKREQR